MERELQRASRDMGACPKCGGPRFEASPVNQVRLLRSGGSAFMNAIRHFSELDAVVCERCGFTELYAQSPEKLRPEEGG